MSRIAVRGKRKQKETNSECREDTEIALSGLKFEKDRCGPAGKVERKRLSRLAGRVARGGKEPLQPAAEAFKGILVSIRERRVSSVTLRSRRDKSAGGCSPFRSARESMLPL